MRVNFVPRNCVLVKLDVSLDVPAIYLPTAVIVWLFQTIDVQQGLTCIHVYLDLFDIIEYESIQALGV